MTGGAETPGGVATSCPRAEPNDHAQLDVLDGPIGRLLFEHRLVMHRPDRSLLMGRNLDWGIESHPLVRHPSLADGLSQGLFFFNIGFRHGLQVRRMVDNPALIN